MVSAERVLEYCDLEPEVSQTAPSPDPEKDKDKDWWPARGEILMDDVSFRHSVDTPLVLKSLSCYIQPSEKVELCYSIQSLHEFYLYIYIFFLHKIGVVGRTGAGKSSLMALLFRMSQPAGSVEIYGRDIRSIPLHMLRRSISIIPQVR